MTTAPPMNPFVALLDAVAWQAIEPPPPETTAAAAEIPYPTHEGLLVIGGVSLRVFQLSDGQRIIDGRDLEDFSRSRVAGPRIGQLSQGTVDEPAKRSSGSKLPRMLGTVRPTERCDVARLKCEIWFSPDGRLIVEHGVKIRAISIERVSRIPYLKGKTLKVQLVGNVDRVENRARSLSLGRNSVIKLVMLP